MSETRVVVLVGSLRADSLNRRIAEKLVERSPRGVSIEIAEGLGEVPFYNEDLDAGEVPEAAQRLRELVAGADRVLAVTPEYNGTMPAVLNNAIDWLSRPYGRGAIKGKPFAVVGTTPTPYGGKWAHEHARRSATIAGAVAPDHIAVSQTSIDVDVLGDEEVVGRLVGAVEALVALEPAAAVA
ncbi:MAG TPA: NADPH-dependent FMN reductase [Pedococcus sp.]|jgi:NAD(P)H-dependent FMN reductase|nr:NADPH-dependent FMN reductase [Pedococcus sp.]